VAINGLVTDAKPLGDFLVSLSRLHLLPDFFLRVGVQPTQTTAGETFEQRQKFPSLFGHLATPTTKVTQNLSKWFVKFVKLL
jgi:hypothetical protein